MPFTSIEQLEDCLMSFSQQYKAGKIVLPNDVIMQGSSGFWNSHLIDRMSLAIERMLASITKLDQGYDLLFKLIIDEVDSHFAKKLELDGIHFIAEGNAFIVGPDGTQHMKLHTNDVFGHSDFIRVPGPEFLGDVRAGLAPVFTYYISMDNLNKYVSIRVLVGFDLREDPNVWIGRDGRTHGRHHQVYGEPA